MKPLPASKPTVALALLTVLVGGLVTGCGGDSGNDSSDADNDSVEVIPSLGAIANATVNVYEANGETLLTSLELGDSNSASFDLSDYSDPIVLEVLGDADATYYDESAGSTLPFPDGEALYALIPEPGSQVTVTVLTDLAYQIAEEYDLWPIDVRVANALNQIVTNALAPELEDITVPPALFDSNTTGGSLADDQAGRYAAKLAALSGLANGEAAPSLFILDLLRTDLVGTCDPQLGCSGDGDIDSVASFSSLLNAELSDVADAFGTSALQSRIDGTETVTGSLNLGLLNLGTAQEGVTFKVSNSAVAVAAFDATASQTAITGPDEDGFFSVAIGPLPNSREAGLRFPDEPGRYSCSEDNSGAMVEANVVPGAPRFNTTESGHCEIIVIQADEVLEGLFSGRFQETFSAPPYDFTDGYFYLERD